MTFDEHSLPALYMIWPASLLSNPPQAQFPNGYTLRTYVEDDDLGLRDLLSDREREITDAQWQDYKDRVLPDGLYMIFHADSTTIVATAGAVHNPNPGRYYFPSGGELGYLVVHPEHRGQHIGQTVSAQVVQRFLSAGYRSIRVGVQGFRLAAIKTYLRVGFVPFLYQRDLYLRWERICEQIGWPYEPEKWPETLQEILKARLNILKQ